PGLPAGTTSPLTTAPPQSRCPAGIARPAAFRRIKYTIRIQAYSRVAEGHAEGGRWALAPAGPGQRVRAGRNAHRNHGRTRRTGNTPARYPTPVPHRPPHRLPSTKPPGASRGADTEPTGSRQGADREPFFSPCFPARLRL